MCAPELSVSVAGRALDADRLGQARPAKRRSHPRTGPVGSVRCRLIAETGRIFPFGRAWCGRPGRSPAPTFSFNMRRGRGALSSFAVSRLGFMQVCHRLTALSDEERQSRIAELSASRLATQRLEAELTWRAMRDGAAILPQADLEPAAVLGVCAGSGGPGDPSR